MPKTRIILPLALVAALAGCDATTFANANQAVITAHQASAQAGTLGLSAAAFSAGSAAVQVVKVLAPGAATQPRVGGPQAAIKTNGATTSAGRRLQAAEPATMAIVDEDAGVDLQVAYFATTEPSGATGVELTSLTGTSQGYDLDFKGSLAFGSGDVDAQLTGTIGSATMAFAVDKLSFATTWPLPAQAAELGRATFRQLEGTTTTASLDAWLKLDAAGTLTADGTVTKDGVETPMAQLGQ